MPFTPAQQSAIDARNRELLIFAAAGSGKTAVLVERILRMIREEGLSIENMLIVTFTRAAAGEMRQRLETRLADAGQSDPRLQREADLVASAQISTIHAFCQQVVRTHFQHCQIDPQFGLCDERTRAAFYQESMEETLDQLYNGARTDSERRSLVAKFSEREITSMLDGLYRFLMSRPDPMEWLAKHAVKTWSIETIDEEPMAVAFCQEASLIIDGMLSLWREAQALSQAPCFPEKYVENLRLDGLALGELQSACQGMTRLIAAVKSLKFSTLKVFKPTTSDEAAAASAFKKLRERYKDMVAELKKLLPDDAEQAVSDLQAMAPATRGLAKTMLFFHDTFRHKKRDQAVIDFNDLEHMTLSVLREPQLQKELSQRFDAIFVDEYQDVSELQEAILNGLKRPMDQPQYAFYVGDVKQSIYRFRLAEPGLFLRKLEQFSADEDAVQRKIILNRNFRSKTQVLDAVNRVFAHVMDRRVTEIDYDADAQLYPGVPSVGDPATELHVLDSRGRRPQDAVIAEAEWIAQDILRATREPMVDGEGKPLPPPRFGDIAILLRVSKNVAAQVAQVLSRHRIPVYCEGAADAMASDEIGQLIQYLVVLNNLMNDVALIAVLRGPLFEMSESELAQIRLQKPEREASFLAALMESAKSADAPLRARCQQVLDTFEQERFYARSMPLGQYVWDFLTRSGLYAHFGAQNGGKLRQANLRMLCTRAAEYEKSHSDGLHGFVESLLQEGPGGDVNPTALDPSENVVRIMTIHKSKGLEFPIVYVMNLGRSLFGHPQSRLFSVHREVGFSIQYVNEAMRTKRTTLLQSAVALREQNAQRAELARVLYVALTRPKSRLVMVGSSGADAEALAQQLAGPSDAYAVRSARSMLDWVLQSGEGGDECLLEQDGMFSTLGLRKTENEGLFSMLSTSYPQKFTPWKVVFHIDTGVARRKTAKKDIVLPAFSTVDAPPMGRSIARRPEGADPIAPRLRFDHRPLKVGVTALCRAMEENAPVSEEEETAEAKRLPVTAQARLLSATPAQPAFLAPTETQRALQTGVETHRLLGLLSLEAVRGADELIPCLKREVRRLVESGVITAAQAEFMDVRMAARFLQSELGKRMLASPRVMREWAFNLRVVKPFETTVQGVIDLCFLENGAWVLIDFKTDRVADAAGLWPKYHLQLGFYRQALEAATPYPVSEAALYALRLGEAYAPNEQQK